VGLFIATSPNTRASSDDKEITPAVANAQPSFWDQQYMLGDWGGTRTELAKEGVTFDFNNIGDFLTDGTGAWLPPILSPLVGGVLGALAYDLLIGRILVQANKLSQDPLARSQGRDPSHREHEEVVTNRVGKDL
jgi:hypothetical protein